MTGIPHNTLEIEPERFMEAYNLDIEDYIERHNFKESAQKTGKQINYMSYSHAYRLFRTYFPELEVALVENEATGGYIFKEIDDRGYFVKVYVYKSGYNTAYRRSATYYYPILNVSGQSVYPDELETYKDKSTGINKSKQGKYVANIQLFNKSIQRAIVKAIALSTGIGLKLWTGDDIDEVVLDYKFKVLQGVEERLKEFNNLLSTDRKMQVSYSDSVSKIIEEGKFLSQEIQKFNQPKEKESLTYKITGDTSISVDNSDVPVVEENSSVANIEKTKQTATKSTAKKTAKKDTNNEEVN